MDDIYIYICIYLEDCDEICCKALMVEEDEDGDGDGEVLGNLSVYIDFRDLLR